MVREKPAIGSQGDLRARRQDWRENLGAIAFLIGADFRRRCFEQSLWLVETLKLRLIADVTMDQLMSLPILYMYSIKIVAHGPTTESGELGGKFLVPT